MAAFFNMGLPRLKKAVTNYKIQCNNKCYIFVFLPLMNIQISIFSAFQILCFNKVVLMYYDDEEEDEIKK